MQRKDTIYILIILVIVVIGTLLFLQYTNSVTVIEDDATLDRMPVEPNGGIGDGAPPLDELLATAPIETLGTSINDNQIDVYRFGTGENNILFIGGVHGGYAPNTSLLAYEVIEYYENNESKIPSNVTLHIIPTMNPDGLITTVGEADADGLAAASTPSDNERNNGRFNANDVDLNRNFDCRWENESIWRNQTVSGGDAPFSEPESALVRNYVTRIDPVAAVVWFAAEGKVYPSACQSDPSNASIQLATTFANAAGYDTEETFDAYAITGDMVNWMASESIPAISVLLTDYADTEFAENLSGLEAILGLYGE